MWRLSSTKKRSREDDPREMLGAQRSTELTSGSTSSGLPPAAQLQRNRSPGELLIHRGRKNKLKNKREIYSVTSEATMAPFPADTSGGSDYMEQQMPSQRKFSPAVLQEDESGLMGYAPVVVQKQKSEGSATTTSEAGLDMISLPRSTGSTGIRKRDILNKRQQSQRSSDDLTPPARPPSGDVAPRPRYLRVPTPNVDFPRRDTGSRNSVDGEIRLRSSLMGIGREVFARKQGGRRAFLAGAFDTFDAMLRKRVQTSALMHELPVGDFASADNASERVFNAEFEDTAREKDSRDVYDRLCGRTGLRAKLYEEQGLDADKWATKLLMNRYFDAAFVFIVFNYIIFLGSSSHEHNSDWGALWWYIDLSFFILFVLELAVRVSSYRNPARWLLEGTVASNWLDFTMTAEHALALFVWPRVFDEGRLFGIGVLRIVRFLKLLRWTEMREQFTVVYQATIAMRMVLLFVAVEIVVQASIFRVYMQEYLPFGTFSPGPESYDLSGVPGGPAVHTASLWAAEYEYRQDYELQLEFKSYFHTVLTLTSMLFTDDSFRIIHDLFDNAPFLGWMALLHCVFCAILVTNQLIGIAADTMHYVLTELRGGHEVSKVMELAQRWLILYGEPDEVLHQAQRLALEDERTRSQELQSVALINESLRINRDKERPKGGGPDGDHPLLKTPTALSKDERGNDSTISVLAQLPALRESLQSKEEKQVNTIGTVSFMKRSSTQEKALRERARLRTKSRETPSENDLPPLYLSVNTLRSDAVYRDVRRELDLPRNVWDTLVYTALMREHRRLRDYLPGGSYYRPASARENKGSSSKAVVGSTTGGPSDGADEQEALFLTPWEHAEGTNQNQADDLRATEGGYDVAETGKMQNKERLSVISAMSIDSTTGEGGSVIPFEPLVNVGLGAQQITSPIVFPGQRAAAASLPGLLRSNSGGPIPGGRSTARDGGPSDVDRERSAADAPSATRPAGVDEEASEFLLGSVTLSSLGLVMLERVRPVNKDDIFTLQRLTDESCRMLERAQNHLLHAHEQSRDLIITQMAMSRSSGPPAAGAARGMSQLRTPEGSAVVVGNRFFERVSTRTTKDFQQQASVDGFKVQAMQREEEERSTVSDTISIENLD
ncbi:unnamed protein product [Amoebophrya sp. A120]|nr:unnamed protein product [Amoebophrya sp. A120]|eukprot:GSA120T00012795001.1